MLFFCVYKPGSFRESKNRALLVRPMWVATTEPNSWTKPRYFHSNPPNCIPNTIHMDHQFLVKSLGWIELHPISKNHHLHKIYQMRILSCTKALLWLHLRSWYRYLLRNIRHRPRDHLPVREPKNRISVHGSSSTIRRTRYPMPSKLLSNIRCNNLPYYYHLRSHSHHQSNCLHSPSLQLLLPL